MNIVFYNLIPCYMILWTFENKNDLLRSIKNIILFDNEGVFFEISDFLNNAWKLDYYNFDYMGNNLYSVSFWNEVLFFDNISIYKNLKEYLL